MEMKMGWTLGVAMMLSFFHAMEMAASFHVPHGFSTIGGHGEGQHGSWVGGRGVGLGGGMRGGPLCMAGDKKRRRRKRKKISEVPTPVTEKTTEKTAGEVTGKTSGKASGKASGKSLAQEMLAQEQMMYDPDDDLTGFMPQRLEDDEKITQAASKAGYEVGGGGNSDLEELFDSREFLQRKREKQLEQQMEQNAVGSSAIPTKSKIKRSDVGAYTRLLEMDPLADEDDSYFEEEGVDAISALLGDVEKKKDKKKTTFLGIGSGPLQVGHFIGALGVILMAYVEYPGFPLTNLPDPLRGALQGGLGTIYLINVVLAGFAFFSAPARQQSSILWAAKTFAVGAIAYDQLMQIPTPEELKRNEEEKKRQLELENKKGRRRQKNK